jgi:hypothetical protein
MEYRQQHATRSWTTRHDEKKRRMQLVSSWMRGPLLSRERAASRWPARRSCVIRSSGPRRRRDARPVGITPSLRSLHELIEKKGRQGVCSPGRRL